MARAFLRHLTPLAFAGLLLSAGVLSSAPPAQAHAATSSLSSRSTATAATTAVDLVALSDMRAAQDVALHYQRGYSVQGNWLCYGWANGAYHCTQHWYRASDGRYVSLNPGFVPSQGSHAPSALSVTTASYSGVSATPAGISQWAYTGRASSVEPSGNTQGYSWGWCTAGAAQLAHDYVGGLGNAVDWARNAAARGMRVSSQPVAGATAVFQPGVQGAGGGGHVSHVAAVYGNGWFLSEDVNFAWNGGGWGRISYRYARSGPGVSFIL